jgi:hypothetical protein
MSSLLFALSEYTRKNKKKMQSQGILSCLQFTLSISAFKGPIYEIFGSKVVLQSKTVLKRKIVENRSTVGN